MPGPYAGRDGYCEVTVTYYASRSFGRVWGGWCAEQASLMRALAYGILDPRGERYQHALSHQRECSACRAYVLSLRGLSAVLPPLPVFLRWSLLGGAGTGAGSAAGAAAVSATGQAGGAVGAASATGAAGGGWLIAGGAPVATKLAVGCLLALGVGAGCVTFAGGSGGQPAVLGSRACLRL